MGETAAASPARGSWMRVALTPVATGGVLFSAAGRLDWIAAWGFIALLVLMQVRVIIALQRTAPDLLVERRRVRPGTKPWDKVLSPLVALVFPLGTWLAAGLDVRHAAAPPFSPAAQTAGLLAALAFAELTGRAMAANRFFSATVRIQKERGHSVVSTGPYAVVRHPGYVGMLGFNLATPFALGSKLAFIPVAGCTIVLIARTALEDRTLRAELAGYADYARRVRWRLLPHIW